MKAAPRPRIDVNLEELDQIIDGGMRAPLSESDGEKLKAVLHILAERAKPRWRTTEKTRAVLPQPPVLSRPQRSHRRRESASRRDMGAMAPPGLRARGPFGCNTKHFTQETSVRNAAWAKSTARRNLKRWCGSWGGRRWRQPGTRWSGCAVTAAGRCSRRMSRRRQARKSMTRQRRR